MMTQKLRNGFEFIKKACFVCRSFNHLIKDCDFHDNKMVEKPVLNNKGRVTGQREIRPVWNNVQRVNHQNKLTHPHPKRNFVPTAVATKLGQVPVNVAKQNSPRAATSISTTRPINIASPKLKVNDALPKTYSYFKAHSPVRRAFNQKSAAKTYNLNEKVKIARVNNVTTAGPKAVVSAAVGYGENVVKSSACWIWRLTGNVIDHTSKDSGSYMLKRFDYVDLQGRLKHMTRNKSFLTNYQKVDGGFVAFVESPKGGKITGKGKIRTEKLDFEDVYFVKELTFNIFSVSQMCDKKNSVLFTETECLVLSPDFKLLDESQVLLKVPRHNNMYSFDLKNVVPLGAVSTACYVKNRVLVTKPHNKTPYELFHGRPPSISFIRPFGCPVTILNTLDPLGKFDGKADERFFVRYYINRKAFRVFNTRTRKVEENLHIIFLENKPNVVGSGPDWLFDIDLLTNSMNYEPVTAGNQTNKNAGIKDNVDAVPTQQYILLPLLYDSPQSSKDVVADDAGKKTNKEPANEGYANSTNRNSIVSPSVSAAGQSFTNADDLPTDPLMPNLEDTANLLNTSIFSGAYDDEDVGAEADLNNLETTMNVSSIPTTRIHKDHPKDQIIGDINSVTQTRRMTKIFKELAMVMQRDDGIFIIQNKYVTDILKKFYFSLIKIESTPIETNKALHKDEEAEDVDVYLYRSMIGSLMYLTASMPNIMFVVCAYARFQVTPKVSHLYAVKRIFRYLKGQPKLGLWYPRDSPFDLEAFSDSDYAGASLDRKSTTGGCQFLGKTLILGQCKKQTVVATSTTEAEYVAAANCCGQVLWIQNQMLDFGFNFMNTKIYIDNESIICIVKNPVFHSKTKHIEIRHHFIRDSYEKKLIQVIKIHTDHNVADLLTKAFDVSSGPIYLVADKTVYKEWEDRMERAAATASSLMAEQDSGNINRTQSMATLNELLPHGTGSGSGSRCQVTILGGAEAQTRFEAASK
ncbi:hypothetical protein Tco_0003860 [Tanacetum coccineum]